MVFHDAWMRSSIHSCLHGLKATKQQKELSCRQGPQENMIVVQKRSELESMVPF
jgi:hypothetical protein